MHCWEPTTIRLLLQNLPTVTLNAQMSYTHLSFVEPISLNLNRPDWMSRFASCSHLSSRCGFRWGHSQWQWDWLFLWRGEPVARERNCRSAYPFGRFRYCQPTTETCRASQLQQKRKRRKISVVHRMINQGNRRIRGQPVATRRRGEMRGVMWSQMTSKWRW